MTSKALHNSKKLNNIVSVVDFEAAGDNTTDDTLTIQAAVNYCFENGRELYFPVGTYLTTNSITNLHAVKSSGPGKISRGTDTWSIEPEDDYSVNIIYCDDAGSDTNDGLSSEQPTRIGKAVDILSNVDGKGSSGVWRIQLLAGTYSQAAVYLSHLPYFKNRIQIWGADPVVLTPAQLVEGNAYEITVVGDTNWTDIGATQATVGTVFIKDNTTATGTGRAIDKNAVPTSIWSGASNSTGAINIVATNPTTLTRSTHNTVGLHIKNVKFYNWAAGVNPIYLYGEGTHYLENCHLDTFAGEGIVLGRGYTTMAHGVIKNSTGGTAITVTDEAILVTYSGVGRFVTFDTCKVGIHYTNSSLGFMTRCKFKNISNCAVLSTSYSRVRYSGNDFSLIGTNYQAVLKVGGILFEDVADTPNIYPTIIPGKPLVQFLGGVTAANPDTVNSPGAITNANKSPIYLHKYSTGSIDISNKSGQTVNLSTTNTSWVPFVISDWLLLSKGALLKVDVYVELDQGSSGLLVLDRAVSGIEQIFLNLENSGTTRIKKGTISIHMPNPSDGKLLIETECTKSDDYKYELSIPNYVNGLTGNVDTLIPLNLFWKPLNQYNAKFVSMRSYIEM